MGLDVDISGLLRGKALQAAAMCSLCTAPRLASSARLAGQSRGTGDVDGLMRTDCVNKERRSTYMSPLLVME